MGLEALVVVDVEGDGGDRRWSVRRGLRVRSEMEGEDEGEGEIVDGRVRRGFWIGDGGINEGF